MLAQEPQLFSSEAGGAVDERLRNRAVNLREARDSDLRAAALSAFGDFNAAENYVGKATLGRRWSPTGCMSMKASGIVRNSELPGPLDGVGRRARL